MSVSSDFLANSEETAKKTQETTAKDKEEAAAMESLARHYGYLNISLRPDLRALGQREQVAGVARHLLTVRHKQYSINTVGAPHVDFSVSSADVQGATATLVVNRT